MSSRDYHPLPKREPDSDNADSDVTLTGRPRRRRFTEFLKRNLAAITITGLILVLILLVMAVIAAITIEPFREVLILKTSSKGTNDVIGQRKCLQTAPRTTLSCGNSTAEAEAMGCTYDPLSACWLHRECPHDYSHEFATFNDGKPFIYYYDEAATHRMKDYNEVGHNVNGFYWTSVREHLVHCLYLLRRGHDVHMRGDRLDTMLSDIDHVDHCTNFLANSLRRPDPFLESLGTQGLVITAFLAHIRQADASYAFYVGKNLTADGSVMVGGTGEEVSSHWLQLFPARNHPPNSTITVGVTKEASFPGELIKIPQANHTFRYLSMEYSDYEGFPAPLTNGGLNEMGVAVRDVWADNREELLEMTPNPQHGLQYSDLARIVMERAATARQGVELIGDLIAKHGESTYGGNSHLIADHTEGWIVWEMAGGKGLWAAQRLGPNEVKVLYPGYIEDFPVDFQNSSDYMGSDNIVSFAVERGWWNESSGKPFNIFDVYGPQDPRYKARDGGYKFMSQAALENATLQMAPVTEEDLMQRVRDHRIADDEAGYGQVVSLRPNVDRDMLRIWIAPTGSVSAPFIPWWLGVKSIPAEFGEHRYLTTGASSSFLSPDYQFQEASIFAGRIFKRVLYYMCSSPNLYLPIVTEMLTKFESESRSQVEQWVEKSAQLLIKAGQREQAHSLLTYYSHSRAAEALEIGRRMNDALDGYIKLTGQWHVPVGDEINDSNEGNETVNCLVGYDPDQPAYLQKQARRSV